MKGIETNTKTGWNLDNSYMQLPKLFFSRQKPSNVPSPELVIFNGSLAGELGLNEEELQSNEGIEMLAGNVIPEGADPIAQAYAGHQFGHFTLLGDGRAVLLGEQVAPTGPRFDVQLKGSGRTPYSRGGDGKAAIGPMLREYIISEAMNALGIPTTRSLAVVATGEQVYRERTLPGAVLTRIAASHIRVGTFEFAAHWGAVEDIKALADYTILRHYPHVKDSENPYVMLLKEAVQRQASLIAQWMLVGFIHGVMNTDNMAISGETIDYGPCAFMDVFNPATVFSSIDTHGRYAYGNQPKIGAWNLARFAETLVPLLHKDENKAVEMAQKEISAFGDLYHRYWMTGMRAKLGLFKEEPEDEKLIEGLLTMMHKQGADYTNTFRALTIQKLEASLLNGTSDFEKWYDKWQSRIESQQESKEASYDLMRRSNPAVIPRNHRVEEALEAAERGDYSVMRKLLDVLSKPFDYCEMQEEYTKLPPKTSGRYRTFCGT